MKISVITPVYNRAELVKKAVSSVMGQTHPVFEIIVVDDGSTDHPEKELKNIGGKKLRILKQANKGVSAARNFGIRESRGNWVAFLDSDDYWLPEKTEAQVDFHKKNKDYLISQTDEIWIRGGKRINPRKYHLKLDGDFFSQSLSYCLISPSAVMISKSLIDNVGYFDENLPVCEDYDLWLRILSRYPVGLIRDKLVVKTGGHSDQLSRKYWGMDRFRVKSIQKLIDSGCLNDYQKKASFEILVKKINILKNGAFKRNKIDDFNRYNKILEKYKI